MAVHLIEVNEPWFTAIKKGQKTVEGRKGTEKWLSIRAGDVIKFVCTDKQSFFKIVKSVKHYGTDEYDPLTNYLIHEGIQNCLPGINSLIVAKEVYLHFYNKDDINRYGMVAIRLK